MIKAVLFDMDGILFDTEIVMKEGWLKAARELNFTLTEEHLSQMRGSALPRSRKLFEEWFHGEAIGTCRREAAFKKISGAGLLFTTSSPQTEASIYWSMPDCFQYPSATRRVVEVATATLIECSFSQERNS